MLFKDFTFPWEPYRAARDEGELQAALNSTISKIADEERLSPECRFAARRLMYACVGSQKLLDVLDGFLVPPPYRLEDLYDRPMSRQEIEAAMDVIPLDLDPVIALLPFNLALGIGVYDAHLRAAVRRLCWLFAIPFTILETQERALMDALLLSGDGDDEALREKRQVVQTRKEGKKVSVRRVAAVGAFAVVGGAALVITGGLAAPLIAPAVGAFASAAAATVGAVGAVGGALLGGTAAAALFAGMIGAATHAAALISLVVPVLTAANVTAIFGIGGVSLAGYKAFRRTADSDVFMIRSITELDELPALTRSDDVLLSVLSEGQLAQWRDAERRLAAEDAEQEARTNVQDVLEEAARGGIVVPAHTRAITMSNVAAKEHFKRRMRCLTFAVQCSLSGYRLELKALKLTAGTWGLVPPKFIPEGSSGVFVCLNRFARPTGAGCVVCYHVRPIANVSNPSLRLWVLTELSFWGNLSVAVAVTDSREAFEPQKMLRQLQKMKIDTDETLTAHNLIMGCCFAPLPFVTISGLANDGSTVSQQPSTAVFPMAELQQRIVETMNLLHERRRIGVAIVNSSKHLIRVLKCELVNGVLSPRTSHLLTAVASRQALLGVFTNAAMSLKGAEAFLLMEVVNSGVDADVPVLHRRCYIKLQFEVSALNSVRVACAATSSLSGLVELPMRLKCPSDSDFKPILMPESFVWADLKVDTKSFVVRLRIEDFVERVARMEVQKCPSLTIAVGGFVSIFDERRPQQDQQVALWAKHLLRSRLFGVTEGYVVHWEDEYQTKFGRLINVELSTTLTTQIGRTVVSKAKGVAKHQLLQGGIFVGLHALDALKGTLALPMYAVWATGAIDNAFATLLNRAGYTGKDLAQALLDPHTGHRPVSLIGFSFGSRVIVECLHELHRVEAFGVIENVYLMGSTVTSSRALWGELRRVVAGRLVNVYSRSDWVLAFLYKVNEASLKPMAGMSPINVPGVENLDVTFLVDNHFDYAVKLQEIIDVIPERPTRQMYAKSLGSPGAVVGLDAIRAVSKRMISSVVPFLGNSPCATLAITNRLVSDVKGLSTELRSLAYVVSGGYFDFEPPDVIPFSRAAVCSVVADQDGEKDESVTGAISYFIALHSAGADLLLTVFFFMPFSGDGTLSAAADVRVVKRARDTVESDAERRRRLEEFCCRETKDSRRIQVRCESSRQACRGAPYTFAFTVDLGDVFSDGSHEAIFHVTTQYEDTDGDCCGACRVDLLALLTQLSTPAQRRKFTVDLCDEICQIRVQPKAATPVPIERMRLAMKEFNDSFASQLKGVGGGAGVLHPVLLVNCSELSLFCAGGGGGSNGAAGEAFAWGEMGLEWIRYPSREIPPHNCVLTVVRRCSSSSASSSSADLVDGGLLDAFSLICASGRCDVQLFASPPAGEAGGGGIEVACHSEVNPSAEGGGNVAVTSAELDGVPFIIVSISWFSSGQQEGEGGESQAPNVDAPGSWVLLN
ncbi:uncharacterized protein Tco025E_01178 [Trypanosoma conorhini]|uniref:Transmembrane protein n=1 Tax=Trypanosoma conorhini TaxID=83891 RepID=A0A422Q914_9TRYP|nr:uncharacterized protein Tco025E_01178 [Trypanosoma conorhini]RNF26456.1 hypothetical protein Tco025E_01178 [Trypanosoma conorhini]